jgi:hypothetical protein
MHRIKLAVSVLGYTFVIFNWKSDEIKKVPGKLER